MGGEVRKVTEVAYVPDRLCLPLKNKAKGE